MFILLTYKKILLLYHVTFDTPRGKKNVQKIKANVYLCVFFEH